ncbi:aminotransferase class III-fold pyridoxal phosphate-dependent enzyme [Actinomadura graeca]|uniref:Aminotransferase class III-fold pyridoxal phosphate-dependent enzyme n=1 Tax=Actinomadura graeca TaxID=2750812 RepID=A0ABX8QRT6_9ACTN|nr:aminotransferase class III-fold pyridoxal phosphate-dependent enzyme [Actinomadura graeca]QXJ21493.1 aminotransferase class III-fold pyridoxal phosphate-dependent enzyme [Actinomadura graeca]
MAPHTDDGTVTDARYERITAGPPEVSDAFLRDVLREGFGLDPVTLRPLAGETDRNTHVVDGAGAEYVLKVTGPAERRAAEFQTALLGHLAGQDLGFAVPEVVLDRSGAPSRDVDGLLVRLLTYVPGRPLAEVPRRSAELLADIGAVAGRLGAATGTFAAAEPPPAHYWEFAHAGTALGASLPHVGDPGLRAAAGLIQARYLPLLDERLGALPVAVVHHDLNAFNLLVRRDGSRTRVSGVIDFGDAAPAPRIADLAVLASSAMRGADRPLAVAAALTAAYHAACPLTEAEIDLLFPLIAVRSAAVAATTARLAAGRLHGDPRHRSSAAAGLVRTLADVPAEVGAAAVRQACGLPPHAATAAAAAWLAGHAGQATAPVAGRLGPLDLAITGDCYDGADPREPDELRAAAREAVLHHGDGTPVGRYGEPRFLVPARRGADVTLGIDLFAATDTPVLASLAGRVEAVGAAGTDLILLHEPAEGVRFRTLYTGLTTVPAPGTDVPAGGRLGEVAADARDGLPPRVRIQVTAVPVADGAATSWTAVPREAPGDEQELWRALFPDPTPLLGDQDAVTAWTPAGDGALAKRHRHLPNSHPTYFSRPITMVRARNCRFYDEHGRSYLDALNNVTLVGHSHPRLVEAAARQLGRLNTNTRFVYDVLSEYAERLTATLPDGLDVVYFVNSGSEANDLALRMSRYLTKREDVVIIDDAYHGYTSVVADVSPSRYRHYGKPDTTHPTPNPDRYRGRYGYDDPQAGAHYAAHVTETFDRLAAEGRAPAAFLFEALLAGGGQVVLPPGYLAPIFQTAARHGAMTIADEVQVGFGRLGEAFWGFETQDVVPDFVTMGKAMGNGFPVAAMVTTREISQAFDPAGRFFSTYGGNPVACAVGLELLNVVEEENLQDNALRTGQYLRDVLAALAPRHEIIGDVRGQGFYSGVEFVLDRETKEPASEETLIICERLKDRGALVYPTGPAWNILKLKPPLTFTPAHADEFAAALDAVLEEGW